ncbi:TetR/AcrR family transcriptional regulator [bacterium]|nr:TetR/AcrR family transcriptional regulator [bacterium]
MTPESPLPAADETVDRSPKERLLDAAEALFAERSFDAVSVRELAAEAGMNVAAVNYHFQGKENLFREVVIRRFTAQRDRTLAGLDALLDRTSGRPRVDDVIRVVVHEYMSGALANSFLTVITREMGSDSHAHAHFFRELVRPVFEAISRSLHAARPGIADDDMPWFIASTIAQVHHFILRRIKYEASAANDEARTIMLQAFPILGADRETYVATVTDRITRFTAAAIDGLCPEEDS